MATSGHPRTRGSRGGSRINNLGLVPGLETELAASILNWSGTLKERKYGPIFRRLRGALLFLGFTAWHAGSEDDAGLEVFRGSARRPLAGWTGPAAGTLAAGIGFPIRFPVRLFH